jgi:hypothetical protein
MLTNAEIDDVSTTDDYKEQLGKIKQLIGERGNTVVDECKLFESLSGFLVM